MMYSPGYAQRYGSGSSSSSRGGGKGMKVKHLVQVVVAMVLFTFFLYQFTNSHRGKDLAKLVNSIDEIDEMLISADMDHPTKVSFEDGYVKHDAQDELIDTKSLVLKSRKMLRPENTPEFEQTLVERDHVEDVVVDDLRDGEDERGAYSDLKQKEENERGWERQRRGKQDGQKKKNVVDVGDDDPDALFYKRSVQSKAAKEEEKDQDFLIHEQPISHIQAIVEEGQGDGEDGVKKETTRKESIFTESIEEDDITKHITQAEGQRIPIPLPVKGKTSVPPKESEAREPHLLEEEKINSMEESKVRKSYVLEKKGKEDNILMGFSKGEVNKEKDILTQEGKAKDAMLPHTSKEEDGKKSNLTKEDHASEVDHMDVSNNVIKMGARSSPKDMFEEVKEVEKNLRNNEVINSPDDLLANLIGSNFENFEYFKDGKDNENLMSVILERIARYQIKTGEEEEIGYGSPQPSMQNGAD